LAVGGGHVDTHSLVVGGGGWAVGLWVFFLNFDGFGFEYIYLVY
jgi:hypothetical protein